MRLVTVVVLSFLLSFCTFQKQAFSQEKKMMLSFEEALKISLEKNPRFKQDRLLEKERKHEKKAALGLYLPSVGVSANYAYLSEDLHLDLTPVRDAITPLYDALGKFGNFSGVPAMDPNTGQMIINPSTGNPVILDDATSTMAVRGQLIDGKAKVEAGDWNKLIQKKQFATLSANISWPIYVGGKIRAANKAARLKCEESELKSKQSYSTHLNEMVERYYGLCLSYKVEKVRKEVFEAMKNHLNDAERMYKGGMIAKVQYLHAKVYFDQAKREVMKSGRQVDIVNEALKNSLGLQEQKEIVPVSRMFYVGDLKTLDYYIAKATESSIILKQVENKKKLAEQKYKVERSELLPAVAAMGMYDIANKDLSPYMPEYMAGLGLRWNIFSGRRALNKTKAARYTVQRVGEIKNKYKADIITGVTKIYQNLQMSIEQLQELKTAMDFALEYLSVREKSFKEGMATSTELVDARLAVTKVKIDRLKVLYDFDVNLSNLYHLCGVPDEFFNVQRSFVEN